MQRLRDAIVEVLENPSIGERAVALGERIRAEDGIATAVEAFEQSFGSSSERAPVRVTNA